MGRCWGVRQRHVAVLAAFSFADLPRHAFGVNVANFQRERFGQTQAAAVDRRQKRPDLQRARRSQTQAHFIDAHHRRRRGEPLERLLSLRKRHCIEKLDAAVSNAHGRRAPSGIIAAVEEVIAHLLLANLLRRQVPVVFKLAHGAGV